MIFITIQSFKKSHGKGFVHLYYKGTKHLLYLLYNYINKLLYKNRYLMIQKKESQHGVILDWLVDFLDEHDLQIIKFRVFTCYTEILW